MMDADLINRERFQSFGRIPGFFFFRKDVRNEKGRKKDGKEDRTKERTEQTERERERTKERME